MIEIGLAMVLHNNNDSYKKDNMLRIDDGIN